MTVVAFKSNSVFVFGAGASADLNVPLVKDFMFCGFQMMAAGCWPITEASFEQVAHYLDSHYGTHLCQSIKDRDDGRLFSINPHFTPTFTLTIEKLLSSVEDKIARGEQGLGPVRAALHDFIFETIDCAACTIDSYAHKGGKLHPHHRNNYNKLVDFLINPADNNAFISFNYDPFLDTALAPMFNEHDLIGNYHLPFKSIDKFPGYESRCLNNPDQKTVDLLKPHGSFNWGRCPKCGEFHLDFNHSYRPKLAQPCFNCHVHLEAVLVPPVSDKKINQCGLEAIWERIRRVLSSTDRLTIIGYSFPEADREAAELFKDAMEVNSKQVHLTIVDPNEDTRLRIQKLFGNKIVLGGCYKNFAEYVNVAMPKTEGSISNIAPTPRPE